MGQLKYLAVAFGMGIVMTTSMVQAKEESVAPGQRFPGPILNMKAPNSQGWKLLESSANSVAFGRSGTSSTESYIAAVIRMPLPDAQSNEDFATFIKQAVEKDQAPDRFRNTESTFEYSDQRGYPCVLYKSIAEDTKARTSMFSRSHLILQVQSLYCRPPNMEKTGFAASFSHRGPTAIDDFDSQASDFIGGVQIPNGEPGNPIEPAQLNR